jgi:hypothetical protein
VPTSIPSTQVIKSPLFRFLIAMKRMIDNSDPDIAMMAELHLIP